MAELRATIGEERNLAPVSIQRSSGTETVPSLRPEGLDPVWRSLLSPRPGQKALVWGPEAERLFRSLSEAGVLLELASRGKGNGPNRGFDFFLEYRKWDDAAPPSQSVRGLLGRGGQWVMVIEGRRCVGFSGWAARRRARREGFERVQTFYLHPSLSEPRMLVPLDRPEPFRYFLRVASGRRAFWKGPLTLLGDVVGRLRLHRELLGNLIVVARRES